MSEPMEPAAAPGGPLPASVLHAGRSPSTEPLIELARARAVAWAPAGAVRAVFLSGSLGRGEPVWVPSRLGPRLLSDLDLFVVVSHAAARDRARRAARAGLPGLLADARPLGLWAPIDVGYYPPADLERLPARPGTLELAGHARCLSGDPGCLASVPRHRAADVPMEEALLLLENRAHELLLGWAWLARGGEEGAWRGAYAAVKCVLDLAGVLSLLDGRYAEGVADRVRDAAPAAGEGSRLAACAPGLPALWQGALAWRRAPELPDGAAPRWWAEAVLAWSCVWTEATARGAWAQEEDPYRRLRRVAARARWRRRLRLAAGARPAWGGPPPLPRAARLLSAARGTLQHRVNACAAALLLSAAEGDRLRPALGPRAARTLRALAPFRPPGAPEWEAWRRSVVRAWDCWFLDGQRSAEAP